MTRRVRVEPASAAAYDVVIGAGVAAGFAGEAGGVLGGRAGRVLAVVDAGVPSAWVDGVLSAWASAGFDIGRVVIVPTEADKSLDTLQTVLVALAERKIERRDAVLAIGGGIVGDVAGFAASAYRRGVPVIQCPTTLLAAVDASVGGKTGVNLRTPGGGLLKNMVGAFHQPRAVLADVTAFDSLDDRQLRAGLAECVKHGMIAAAWGDADLFGWMRESAGAVLRRDRETLIECVARNVAVKARVVAADEREESDTGGRALLNLGHTYAHAMETLNGVSVEGVSEPGLLHGEAVALGLIAASACSAAMGRTDGAYSAEVAESVRTCGLPTRVRGLPDDGRLLERMGHDKKASGGRLRLTLPSAPARAELVTDPPIDAVCAGWSAIRG